MIGGRLFRLRLVVGLLITGVGLEVIRPTPLFGHPYRLVHSFASLLVLGGLALRAWGAGSAGGHTRSGIIEAVRLATGGPFAYVRNPIYLGSMGIGFGMAALIGDPWAYVLTAIAFSILYLSIVPAEEAFLVEQFGDEYRHYREGVPRFIPTLRPFCHREHRPFQWRAVRGEFYMALLLVGIYLALLVEEHFDKL